MLLERIDDAPSLIGAVMTVNALAGFVVPLAVGAWSDRREASGLGRRLPFMIGGTAVAAGGLVAVALGNGSSYIALGLAAARRLHRAERADHAAPGAGRGGRRRRAPPGRDQRPGAAATAAR